MKIGFVPLPITVALLCWLTPVPASACTIIWDEQYAFRTSDAVVWGTFMPGSKRGEGTIEVSSRVKGPKLRSVPIRWNADWVGDGVQCDPWQLRPDYPGGRFFLTDNGDGTFSVRAQTPNRKAKR